MDNPNVRLQILRRARGQRQIDLAQLSKVGLSTIIAAEGGNRKISLASKKKIVLALGVSLSDIFSA